MALNYPKPVTTLRIGCSDGRGNGLFDEENKGQVLDMRSPGPNLFSTPVRSAIFKALEENPGIVEVVLKPHLLCGAMGAVNNTLHNKISIDPQIYSYLIQPLSAEKFADRDDLEAHVNPEAQARELRNIIDDYNAQQAKHGKPAREIAIKTQVWDPHKLPEPVPENYDKHPHVLLVTAPSRSHYNYLFESVSEGEQHVGMWGTYLLQPPDLIGVKALLAAVPGIKSVVLYAETKEDSKEMEKFRKTLETQPWMSEIKLTIYDKTKSKLRSF